MIQTDALQKLKFEEVTDEDWNLTVRLYENGYKIKYNPKLSASGECPNTFKKFIKQQSRWAEGHTRTFREHFMKILGSKHLNLSQKLDFLITGYCFLHSVMVTILMGALIIVAIFPQTTFPIIISQLQTIFLIASIPSAILSLKYAASKAGSTRSKGMESMTVSMLEGEEGKQVDDLTKLVDFLKTEVKPDVVHISNALLLGLAPKIKNETHASVVCSLQDEDGWINDMEEPYKQQALDLINRHSEFVDAFISVSDYYKKVSLDLFNIPEKKIKTIYNGIDLDQYKHNSLPETPTIGFISRMNALHGLDDLTDAFIILKKQERHKYLKLKITGGSTGDDTSFIKRMKRKLIRNNVMEDVEINDDYIGYKRHHFLNSLTLFCAPVKFDLAFGIYLIEALASGLPVVQPKIGAFEEIVSKTEAGLLYEPITPENLAKTLDKVLSDEELLNRLKTNAINNTGKHFDIAKQVKIVNDLYRELVGKV